MQKKENAFTLIEVLIALLIIAIALAAAIRATNSSIRATIHVRNAVTAHWVGLNILSEMQTHSGVSLPKPGNQVSGETNMLDRHWEWTARAETTAFSAQITQVTVTVRLRNRVINIVTGYVL